MPAVGAEVVLSPNIRPMSITAKNSINTPRRVISIDQYQISDHRMPAIRNGSFENLFRARNQFGVEIEHRSDVFLQLRAVERIDVELGFGGIS